MSIKPYDLQEATLKAAADGNYAPNWVRDNLTVEQAEEMRRRIDTAKAQEEARKN